MCVFQYVRDKLQNSLPLYHPVTHGKSMFMFSLLSMNLPLCQGIINPDLSPGGGDTGFILPPHPQCERTHGSPLWLLGGTGSELCWGTGCATPSLSRPQLAGPRYSSLDFSARERWLANNTPQLEVHSPDCSEPNTIPYLRLVKTIKKVKKVENCQKLCQNSDSCDYFKWKVGQKLWVTKFTSFCLFQTHKKVNRRMCQLLQIQYRARKGWFSGPQSC